MSKKRLFDGMDSREEWVERLNDYLETLRKDTTHRVFSIDAPMALTVKRSSGYTKRPFIGGEEFSIHSAYVGKRGLVIFRFTPESPSDFDILEVPEGHLDSVFDGHFSNWIDDQKEFFTSVVMPKKAESVEDFEKRLESDPRFGCWA